MKKTTITHTNGVVTQSNWMLDETIKAFEESGLDNDAAIKRLTNEKIEYGRICMRQLLSMGGSTIESITAYHDKLDKELQASKL